MTDDLYERYKEALRVGHVAVLRGALEEALTAYGAAAEIAPSRALPHTSLGGVLLRLGRLDEALVEYAGAVARAPHDEGALLGQAEALTMAGQRVDAAQALDHVAEIQEAAGRLPEAADTLRRALELEEAPQRARHQRGLLREIRLSAGDQAAEQLLARALRLRDEPSEPAHPAPGPAAAASPVQPTALPASPAQPAAPSESPSGGPEVAPSRADLATVSRPEPVAAQAGPQPTAPEPQTRSEPERLVAGATDAASALYAAEPDHAGGPPPPPEPAAQPPAPAAAKPIEAEAGAAGLAGPVGESGHQPTGDELMSAAETAEVAGDSAHLRSLLLWTARAYAREGRFEAGLDATHRLLQWAPGDVDAHLVLVELYVARDWNSLAAEKLILLGRLADLNDDAATRQRLCEVASRAFPKDERLTALCT
jgi:tetratricopeptide (TPR) repeat protein